MTQRWGWLLLLALLPAGPARGENIARIDRLQPSTLEQQAGQRAGLFSERRFEGGGASARVIGNGQWRVYPRAGIADPLLVVYHPYNARVTVHAPGDATPRTQDLFQPTLDPQFSRRALVTPPPTSGTYACCCRRWA